MPVNISYITTCQEIYALRFEQMGRVFMLPAFGGLEKTWMRTIRDIAGPNQSPHVGDMCEDKRPEFCVRQGNVYRNSGHPPGGGHPHVGVSVMVNQL